MKLNPSQKVNLVYCVCGTALCYVNRQSDYIWFFAIMVGIMIYGTADNIWKGLRENENN